MELNDEVVMVNGVAVRFLTRASFLQKVKRLKALTLCLVSEKDREAADAEDFVVLGTGAGAGPADDGGSGAAHAVAVGTTAMQPWQAPHGRIQSTSSLLSMSPHELVQQAQQPLFPNEPAGAHSKSAGVPGRPPPAPPAPPPAYVAGSSAGAAKVHPSATFAGAGAAAGARASSRQWSCGACTFLNSALLSKCEMCETERPQAVRTPPVTPQRRAPDKQGAAPGSTAAVDRTSAGSHSGGGGRAPETDPLGNIVVGDVDGGAQSSATGAAVGPIAGDVGSATGTATAGTRRVPAQGAGPRAASAYKHRDDCPRCKGTRPDALHQCILAATQKVPPKHRSSSLDPKNTAEGAAEKKQRAARDRLEMALGPAARTLTTVQTKVLMHLLVLLDVSKDNLPTYTVVKYELIEKFGQASVDGSKAHIKTLIRQHPLIPPAALRPAEERGSAATSEAGFPVGSRVRIAGAPLAAGLSATGTVRFHGHVVVDWDKSDADASKVAKLYGVRLDEPCGGSDGTLEGVRYWKCHDNYGVFCAPAQLELLPPLAAGTRVACHGKGAGTVRYHGFYDKDEAGTTRYGVELDDKIGTHDGTVGGIKYFQCPRYHGFMAKMENVNVLHTISKGVYKHASSFSFDNDGKL